MTTALDEMQARMKRFEDVLKRSGVKLTHQRIEIYRELARTTEHPDAETIYTRVRRRIPTISLDTVYRTLRLLEEKAVISRAGLLSQRTRFDANTDQHHHFACTKCGLIRDICSDLKGIPTPKEVEEIGKVDTVHVELRGVCEACRRKGLGEA